jgi:hypothetical protein
MPDKAIGLIRSDLSEDVAADERAVREAADWSDLDLAEVIVFDADTTMPLLRLLEVVHKHRATVLIVPTAAHHGDVGRAFETAGVSVLCAALHRGGAGETA